MGFLGKSTSEKSAYANSLESSKGIKTIISKLSESFRALNVNVYIKIRGGIYARGEFQEKERKASTIAENKTVFPICMGYYKCNCYIFGLM